MSSLPNIIISDDLRSATNTRLRDYVLHAYCTEGKCRFEYNNTPMEVGKGDCIIMSSHADRLRNIVPDSDFRVEIIYITHTFANISTPQSNYGTRGAMALFNEPVMHLTPTQQQVCALNFDYIRRRHALQHHHFHRDAMINAVQCMIIDFYDFHAALYGNRRITVPNSQLLDKFIAMLDRGEYRKYREVQHYATQLCVTPKYLSEVCRRFSGHSALYWITRYTSLDISRMLRNPALTIEEISDYYGFSSINYFIRYVKKNLGVLPGAFRE